MMYSGKAEGVRPARVREWPIAHDSWLVAVPFSVYGQIANANFTHLGSYGG